MQFQKYKTNDISSYLLNRRRWQGCSRCGYHAYTRAKHCPQCARLMGPLFPHPFTDKSWNLVVMTIWKGIDPNQTGYYNDESSEATSLREETTFENNYLNDERGA